MGNDVQNGRIQVLERAAVLLNLFTPENPQWRFSDLVQASGLNKSTVFNIVDTLRQLDLLEQDGQTKQYRLGRQILWLGTVARRSVQIVRLAEPYMTALRDLTGETVQLARLEQDKTVYLHKMESLQSVQTNTMIGAAIPAYATGLGKAILAFRDGDYLQKYFSAPFAAFTPNTLRNREELEQELAQVRREGIACDREEYSPGLTCYACPVFDHRGAAAYALSVSAPVFRMTEERSALIRAELSKVCRELSRQLGYQSV